MLITPKVVFIGNFHFEIRRESLSLICTQLRPLTVAKKCKEKQLAQMRQIKTAQRLCDNESHWWLVLGLLVNCRLRLNISC